MVQNRLIILSLFFVLGIVTGMQFPLSHSTLPFAAGAALSVFVCSAMLARNGQRFMPVFLLAGLLAGWANFSWRTDATSSHHIVHFADDREYQEFTEVGGWIVKEPEIRPYKTNVVIRPEYVRVDEAGEKVPISGGLVMLQFRPSMGSSYDDYNYGDYVITRQVSLTRPATANNPGVFDYRTFLRNNDIYGLMTIRREYQLSMDADKAYDNLIVDFALDLKKKLLWNIKKTMPYPESAFLGGVMLGLRQGLSRQVQDEFRAAGVAHVLAVSGLHVTIITALLFGLLSLFKVPRKFIAPPTIAGLIIFAIITGGRPSTLRAVIMNSIALISYCYLASNLRTSLLFGISVAALAILFFMPMILFEASFLYSFMAVLALALLTGPLLKFLNRYLDSVHAIFFFLFLCVSLGTLIMGPALLVTQPPYAVVLFLALSVVSYLFRGFFSPRLRFSRLPYWFTSFTAAQMAIQLGLGPLNAYYFQKYSLAAPLANFIAIPLIGINVQLGIVAGLLGFIPLVGDFLGLLINASNWLGVRLFLGSAAYFARAIPYPDVTPPTLWFMSLYYIALLYIAFRVYIHGTLRPGLMKMRRTFRDQALRKRAWVAGISLLLFFMTGWSGMRQMKVPTLRLTVFDLAVFGMGGGNSQFIEFPDHQTMLVDAGVANVSLRGKNVDWNMGEMLIAQVLRSRRLTSIDWVVLTSPDSECSGGIPAILSGFKVKNFLDSAHFPGPQCRPDLDFNTFLELLGDEYYAKKPDAEQIAEMYANYIEVMTQLFQNSLTARKTVARGTVLIDEMINGKHLQVKVLHPPAERLKTYRTTTNNSLVIKISYGDFSCLLPSLITIDGMKDLLSVGEELQSRVMIAPFHGFKGSFLTQFVKKVKPELVIIQATPSRWKMNEVQNTVDYYENLGCRTLRTDMLGAVIVSSQGDSTFQVTTMLEETADNQVTGDTPDKQDTGHDL